MLRRVIILVVVGIVLLSLGSLAQNTTTAPAPSTGSNQAQNPNATPAPAASTPPAPTTGNSQAQNAPQTQKSTKTSSKKKSKKAQNPIANVDSKQPDKVLFDRAMDAMKHNKYDVARLSLQTLINTYPDSEYIARAKLAIGDSWYQEGGTAAMAQAESEYKDFITFFPNMPEAAEAQMKIANIHYKEMEKADRDPTHAKRAEEEYRQLIMQFPDSSLVPQAKLRLLEVQEVLADREYQIGHFYYLRESYPAAIARFKSVTDTYPLYSGADDALFELGGAYEKEIALIRRTKLPETAKGTLIKQYTDGAQAAYDRILTRYPLQDRAKDARKRLEAMNLPVPKATDAAIAQNKAEMASRRAPGTVGKVMENFHKGPDLSEATKVGEPTLVDPKQSSAPDMVRAANSSVMSSFSAGTGNSVAVEHANSGAPPPENAPLPRSEAAPGATTGGVNALPASGDANNTAIPEMQNDLQPAAGSSAGDPAPPKPVQVNDAAAPSSTTDNGSQTPAAAGNGTQQPAAPASPTSESTSKKKKKKVLGIF